MLFTCIKSWFFRNHLANFHQISHWSFWWNVIDSLFKWSCSIDCQTHIFFFKTKNCSNDDIFISCDDRIGKMLHNICMSAVAMSLRWANRGTWASCFIHLFHRQNHTSQGTVIIIKNTRRPLHKPLLGSHIHFLRTCLPASILRKSTSGRHRPVSYPDGPMTARYRFT